MITPYDVVERCQFAKFRETNTVAIGLIASSNYGDYEDNLVEIVLRGKNSSRLSNFIDFVSDYENHEQCSFIQMINKMRCGLTWRLTHVTVLKRPEHIYHGTNNFGDRYYYAHFLRRIWLEASSDQDFFEVEIKTRHMPLKDFIVDMSRALSLEHTKFQSAMLNHYSMNTAVYEGKELDI